MAVGVYAGRSDPISSTSVISSQMRWFFRLLFFAFGRVCWLLGSLSSSLFRVRASLPPGKRGDGSSHQDQLAYLTLTHLTQSQHHLHLGKKKSMFPEYLRNEGKTEEMSWPAFHPPTCMPTHTWGNGCLTNNPAGMGLGDNFPDDNFSGNILHWRMMISRWCTKFFANAHVKHVHKKKWCAYDAKTLLGHAKMQYKCTTQKFCDADKPSFNCGGGGVVLLSDFSESFGRNKPSCKMVQPTCQKSRTFGN